MDRGDWWATVHSVTGVRNDLVTKPKISEERKISYLET